VPVLEVEETSASVLAERLTGDLLGNRVLLRWLVTDAAFSSGEERSTSVPSSIGVGPV
jgi:hypothetical protein